MRHPAFALGSLLVILTSPPSSLAAHPKDQLLDRFATQAKQQNPGFAGFSAQRGEQLYRQQFTGGNADTPSCTSCHRDSPRASGQTRAGKPIEPLALSLNPQRLTDPEKVAKWFLRNCKGVLGRECTPIEKGDFIQFMASQ